MRGWRGANVCGLGVVSCLGRGVAPLIEACLAGRSGVTPDAEFGVPTGRIGAELLSELRAELAASPFARAAFADESLDGPAAKPLLLTAYALAAALAPLGPAALGPDTGVIFATTTGHMAGWEHQLPAYVAGERTAAEFAPAFRDHHLGRSLDALVANLGFAGPFQVLTSACAAGTQALALAHAWLKTGKVRRCLVGATETLTTLTVRGFDCFNLLAPGIAAPFGRLRAGINLGEAAVFLRLEADPDLPGHGYVLSGATAMDAFDMTRPDPEGRGLHSAVRQALAAAGRRAADIDWVYAHGTGTDANDAAEAAALRMALGDWAPWVSSTKAVHGHALAASGLLETAIALAAMRRGVILASANAGEPDPALRLKLATVAVPGVVRTVLKTTLGFGGVNAACVLATEAPA